MRGMPRARWYVLLGLALVVAQPVATGRHLSPAGVAAYANAQGSGGPAPQAFTNAVMARYAAMAGAAAPTSNWPRTFAQLQSLISGLATYGSGWTAQSGQYVDPDTGTLWDLHTLLKRASGRETWLGDDAAAPDREAQIKQVLAALTWRLAAFGQLDGLTKTAHGSFSKGCTDDGHGHSQPAPELLRTFQDLFTQAQAATAQPGGGLYADANWISVVSKATVSFGRAFVKVALPQPGPYAAGQPLRGVAVDGARLAVTTYVPSLGVGRLSLVGAPAAAAWQAGAGDWDAPGTTVGTVSATPPGSTHTVMLPLPTGLLFAPGGDSSNPRFRPALRIRFAGQEPPPNWLSHLKCPRVGSGDNTGTSANTPDSGGVLLESTPTTELKSTGIIYHEAFPPLTLAPARIERASLDFDARARRRLAALRDLAVSLGNRKLADENAIVVADQNAQGTLVAAQALQPQISALQSQVKTTQDALDRLREAERETPTSVKALFQAEASLEQDMATVEAQLLQSKAAGADVRNAEARLARDRGQLGELDAELRSRLADSPLADLRARWLASLRALETKAFTLRDAETTLLAQQAGAEAEVTRRRADLVAVYAQLMDLAQRIAIVDPEVTAVEVRADGSTVFRAVSDVSYAHLFSLNLEIEKMATEIARLGEIKNRARDLFLPASKAAIASEKQLAALLSKLAWARYFTALGFDSYDIVRATMKGGVVGAAAELGKKLLEKALLPQAVPNPSNGITPGSIEDEINQQYQAGLRDTWSGAAVGQNVFVRGLKDTWFKLPKDTVNKYLGTLVFEKITYPLQFRLEVARHLLPGTASEYARAEAALLRLNKQLDTLKKGYVKSVTSFKNIAETVTKEVVKTLVNGYLDRLERQSWVDYYEKQLEADAYYPFYYTAAQQLERALEYQDFLLDEKARLLQGLGQGLGLRTLLSKEFRGDAHLQILLTLQGGQDPADPLAVAVGGAPAERAGQSNQYRLSADVAAADPGGALPLVMR